MMYNPAGHRVIVRPDPVEEVSEGGIVTTLPENVGMEQAGQVKGTLVGVGPNAWKAFDDGRPWASIGDRVIYSKYAGRYLEDPEADRNDPNQRDAKVVILNDEDILATISE